MKRLNTMKKYAKLALLGCTLALATGPAAAVTDHFLIAKEFQKMMPDGSMVTMWGYAEDMGGACFNTTPISARRTSPDCLGPVATAPGPRLTVPVDEQDVRLRLTNMLSEPTSIVIPGQKRPHSHGSNNGPTWNDNNVGSRTSPTQRVRSFGREAAANGGRRNYVWRISRNTTFARPGTFIYHSGTLPQKQVYMGLYGAVTKDAAAGEAYPGISYDNEVILFYSDIDPAFNTAVANNNLTTAIERHPTWFLINGEPYEATGPNATMDIGAGAGGESTLLRFLSAASENHVPVLQGMHMMIHAEDGLQYGWQDTSDNTSGLAPREQYSAELPPLKTRDAIITLPATAGRYAVYDGNGYMTNPSDPTDFDEGDEVGGMLRFLSVGTNDNIPPEAFDDTAVTDEDVAVIIPVLDNDTDADVGDVLTVEVMTNPANGTVVVNGDNTVTYTPAANFNGIDSFTYVANDNIADSNTAIVTITVNAVNDVPVAADDTASTDLDVAVIIPVLDNDTDADVGDVLTVASVTNGPSNGAVVINGDNTVTYTPTVSFTGTDTFTYVANDGTVDSNAATVMITVNELNVAPVAMDDSATTSEDVAVIIDVLANDTDSNAGDTLTVTGITNPSNGTVVVNGDNTVTYTPAANFNGTDTFTYVANDGTVDSNTAMVTITVTTGNDAPVAADDTATTDEDVAVTIPVLANDTDTDIGDVLTAAVVGGPTNGTVVVNGDYTMTYTPTANYNGPDSFTYVANDGTVNSSTATVTITVNAVDDAPTITSTEVITATEAVTYNYAVTAADVDVGDTLTFSLDVSPSGMTIDGTTGGISWVPDNSHVGQPNDVTVRVTDDGSPANLSAIQSFQINVAPAGGPPVVLYLSLINNGTVGGVTYADEDILSYDSDGNYAMFFDGSAAGVAFDVFGFDVLDANTVLLSFSNNQTLPGGVLVTNQDIVAYDMGAQTFSLYFDGSDVGLSGDANRLDGFNVLADGSLIITTRGAPTVPGVTGAADEDLLRFIPDPGGIGDDTSAGTWEMYFDASDAGIGGDTNAVAVAANGDIYLSNNGVQTISGVTGQNEDVLICVSPTTGTASACSSGSLFFEGIPNGTSDNIDAIDLP